MIYYDKTFFLEQILRKEPDVIRGRYLEGKTNWRLALRDLGLVKFDQKEEVFHALNKGREEVIEKIPVSELNDIFTDIVSLLQQSNSKEDGFTNYPFFLEMSKKYTLTNYFVLANLLAQERGGKCFCILDTGKRCDKNVVRFGLCEKHIKKRTPSLCSNKEIIIEK